MMIKMLQAQSEEDHEDDLTATDNAQGQFMEEFFEQVGLFIFSYFCF